MEHAEALAYLDQAERSQAEETLRYFISYYSGRAETEEEFTQGRHLMLNKQIDAEEAAQIVMLKLSEEKMTEVMRMGEEETNAFMREQETQIDVVRAAGETNVYTTAESVAIRQGIHEEHNAIVIAGEQATADAVMSIWERVGSYLRDFFDWVDTTMFAGLLPGGSNAGFGQAPSMATGGSIKTGGLVNVHRNEKIYIPSGAEVIPAHHSANVQQAMMGGGGDGGITVNFNGPMNIASDMDIRDVSRKLGKAVRKELSARGGNAAFGVA
jgi:hypothetical protein